MKSQDYSEVEDWPGYFGSPRLARADIGADQMEALARNVADLALRIIGGRDSLARIARHSGFADQSHMGRIFRESVGVTPGRLRRTAGVLQRSGFE